MINPWRELSKVSPQKEDGHRRISTELLRVLMYAPLTSVQYKIIFCIIDKTWGFNKLSNVISISQIMESTNLAERTVRKAAKSLKNMRIIYYQSSKTVYSGAPLNEYLFNKYYDTWLVDKVVDNSLIHKVYDGAGCTPRAIKGAHPGQNTVHTHAPLYINNIKNINSISKLYPNSNNKSERDIAFFIEKSLSKIATTKDIIKTLSVLDGKHWYKVREYLQKRYTKDNDRGFNKAVIEMRKQQEVAHV